MCRVCGEQVWNWSLVSWLTCAGCAGGGCGEPRRGETSQGNVCPASNEPRDQDNISLQEVKKPTTSELGNHILLVHNKERHRDIEQNISDGSNMALGTHLPEYRSWCAQEELKNKVGQKYNISELVHRKSLKQRRSSSSVHRKIRKKFSNKSRSRSVHRRRSLHWRSRSRSAHRRSRTRSAHRNRSRSVLMRSRSRSAHRRSRSRTVHRRSRSQSAHRHRRRRRKSAHRRSRSKSAHRRSRSRSTHRRSKNRSSCRSRERSLHTKSRSRSKSKKSHIDLQKASKSPNEGHHKKTDYQSDTDVSVEHKDSEYINNLKAENMKKEEEWEQLDNKSSKSTNQTTAEKTATQKSMFKNFIQGDLPLEQASHRKHGPWCKGKYCFDEKCWYQDQVQDAGLQCVSRGTSSKPCKFFKPGSSCRFGDNCKNMHMVVKTPASAKVCESSTCEEKVSEYSTGAREDSSMWTMGPDGKLQLLSAPVQAPPSVFEAVKVSPLTVEPTKAFSPIPPHVGENSLSILASCYAEKAPSSPPSVSLLPTSIPQDKVQNNNQIKNASTSTPKTEEMFACMSKGTNLRICHNFRNGYCPYGSACHYMHIVPWDQGIYGGAPIISASAFPGTIPKGFKCQSIGSTHKQCSYFDRFGKCTSMDMCLDMHLVPSTESVKFEVGSGEKNKMEGKLNVQTESKEKQWSKNLLRNAGPNDSAIKANIKIKVKSKIQAESKSQGGSNIQAESKCQSERKCPGERKSQRERKSH